MLDPLVQRVTPQSIFVVSEVPTAINMRGLHVTLPCGIHLLPEIIRLGDRVILVAIQGIL